MISAPLLGFDANEAVDFQFFGDTYLSDLAIKTTQSNGLSPGVFEFVHPLLKRSRHNIVNLEGVITKSGTPFTQKEYLLAMPEITAVILANAKITAVTLANNHSMDFGLSGLTNTLIQLSEQGIVYTGAGYTLRDALKTMILTSRGFKICIAAFSRTLPESFWASSTTAGTASANPDDIKQAMNQCVSANALPIAVFHWGRGDSREPQTYQQFLARTAIDAGAKLVIGHHPHILQSTETYKNQPIFYSIGNFAFATSPKNTLQEGVGIALKMKTPQTFDLEVIPLDVQNPRVGFKPRISRF